MPSRYQDACQLEFSAEIRHFFTKRGYRRHCRAAGGWENPPIYGFEEVGQELTGWAGRPALALAKSGRPPKSLLRRRSLLSLRVRSISLPPTMNTTAVQAANISQPPTPG